MGNGCYIMPLNSPGGSTLQWGAGRFAISGTTYLNYTGFFLP